MTWKLLLHYSKSTNICVLNKKRQNDHFYIFILNFAARDFFRLENFFYVYFADPVKPFYSLNFFIEHFRYVLEMF